MSADVMSAASFRVSLRTQLVISVAAIVFFAVGCGSDSDVPHARDGDGIRTCDYITPDEVSALVGVAMQRRRIDPTPGNIVQQCEFAGDDPVVPGLQYVPGVSIAISDLTNGWKLPPDGTLIDHQSAANYPILGLPAKLPFKPTVIHRSEVDESPVAWFSLEIMDDDSPPSIVFLAPGDSTKTMVLVSGTADDQRIAEQVVAALARRAGGDELPVPPPSPAQTPQGPVPSPTFSTAPPT